jgi:hypothetical protein
MYFHVPRLRIINHETWRTSGRNWQGNEFFPKSKVMVICGGREGTGTDLSRLFFPRNHSTNAPYPSIIIPNVCDRPEQPTHCHNLNRQLGLQI